MRVLRTAAELFACRKAMAEEADVGVVLTMGNLHQGHLSLLAESLQNHPTTFFTIFVNPKQFAPHEDFDRYPRTLEKDLELIREVYERSCKQLVIFAPSSIEEVFPPGYDSVISVGKLTRGLCGKSRPGHFDGVTTVVERLFAMIKPRVAYFGQKDYQQFLVIKKMVCDLLLDIDVRSMPIVRDDDGLALSSRNSYLTSEERKHALVLAQTLQKISEMVAAGDVARAKAVAREVIASDNRWEYLEILDGESLQEVADGQSSEKVAVLGALRLRKTRLIDNVVLVIGGV
ncbi:MAG: pantoate--beta-alanine ligase [Oligoflexia bacterium]|nr:pantoate--beta-alanine ligase [Oligoflexia bacterium]MBF0365954.1 pantoate--beta-alanine ligase [Oligoflexia bacterium]